MAVKKDTWDLCTVCGKAVVYRRTKGWVHSLLGVGNDHAPAPKNHPAEDAPAAAPANDSTALASIMASALPVDHVAQARYA